MRREFPTKVKVSAFDRSGGKCEHCGIAIRPGNGPNYDHRVMDAIGGEPTLENCQVLCRACHGLKTNTEDIPKAAKSKRVRACHINAEKPRGWWQPPGYKHQLGRR